MVKGDIFIDFVYFICVAVVKKITTFINYFDEKLHAGLFC